MSKLREGLGRVRDLPDEELQNALDRAREELFRLRLGNYTNQVENTISLRYKRRELARILTVQRARELALETQAEAGRAASVEGGDEVEAPARGKAKPAKKKAVPAARKPAPAKAAAKKPAAAKTAKKPAKSSAPAKTSKKSGKE